MLKGLFSRVVGDSNQKEIRKLQPLVDEICAREPAMERRTDAELRGLTDQLRARVAAGQALDEVLVEAFAAVREAAKRRVALRPFDVQLLGGIILHQGKVAEMKTGEGKTLVATLPIYLNALGGQGVHLVTVNDYLARRDTLWMGPVYHMLGLTVGLLQQGADQPAYLYDPGYQRDPYPRLRPVPRSLAYAADVTYGTNNEFGFDYLRDNLALSLAARVQRSLHYAIVDEVDNIFIDEARTPLIISGPSAEPVEEYSRFAAIARQLQSGVHFELDEKERTVFLTDEGLAAVERETGIENIYDEANYRYVHYMQQALKAQVLFQEGRDYIRQRKHIVLIDPHTGRLMPNRRLSEGLHQAIEAKEAVPILPRDVTSATITIQNYFRMYDKLAGMSGTAVTESEEFFKIYKLDVVAIPTNVPMIREDYADVVYRTEEAKLRAVAREILSCHCLGRPVLVGTTSVEMSERVSGRLSGDRLQMAAIAPLAASSLLDSSLDREQRSRLGETLNASLETANAGAWRKLLRDLELEPNPLSLENVDWIMDYLRLPDEDDVRRTLEQALREGIPHQVLNAKEHTREASIIARAGEPGTVTIATNMAGRGVDIRLGGELAEEVIQRAHQSLRGRSLDPFQATSSQMDSAVAEVVPQYAMRHEQVLAAGGLHILGTERHEARRIDNQLRGRAGRQGEPGSSRFYLSLEDDLMRRFGRKEILSKLMEQIGDDLPIEHGLVSKTIERAQASVEGYNFDIRKHLLEYDDVLNRQRDSIYAERLRILRSEEVRDQTWRMLEAQVDEYLGKLEQEPDQLQHLFASLDDLVPLILPAPSAPFRGPVAFGSHLTAFPPFSICFVAHHLTGQSPTDVRQALRELARQAADAYGGQLRHALGETARTTQEGYEERLDRFRTQLDEKIQEYLELVEERQEAVDLRRLGQLLERTFPLKLTTPRQLGSVELEDLRRHWLDQIETEFHRQTCSGLIDRARMRLPVEAAVGMERMRPSRLAPKTLATEIERVRELALAQVRDEPGRQQLGRVPLSAEPSSASVAEFAAAVKANSSLDFARLDRLVAHILGDQLYELIEQYQAALPSDGAARADVGASGRLQADLERLRESVLEGKKGGRADLITLLRQLNELVHLELDDLERLLSVSAAQEYDKWAQRQRTESEADAEHSPLPDSTWSAIAEHLLATQFTQRLGYDKEHRRQVSWLPRLPLNFLARAQAEGLEGSALRDVILEVLQRAIEQRETAWGRQEFERWKQLSLHELDDANFDGLIRSLGADEAGEHLDERVEDLPPDLSEVVRFVLQLRLLHDQPIGLLPRAESLLVQLEENLRSELLDTRVAELGTTLVERVGELLRRTRALEDPSARQRLLEQPIRDWDRRMYDLISGFLGRQFIETHKDETLRELDPDARDLVLAYLHRQRRFVDEERVKRFLVREGLTDLPPATRQAALIHLAGTRLESLGRRKLSNLDVNTRQQVLDSLQRLGLFSDPTRRAEIFDGTLAEMAPGLRSGFGAYLARHVWGASSCLNDLDALLGTPVLDRLRDGEALEDLERVRALPARKLHELDGGLGEAVRARLVRRLREDLATKTMEGLPAATREAVHRELAELGYFVDAEKVGWYERRTLAQLPSDTLQGLEGHLGRIRFEELAGTPFKDLSSELQNELLAIFDAGGILAERAERLRFTQSGTLSALPSRERDRIVQQLGRRWLVRIRDRRPPALPDRERGVIDAYLRRRGQFSDEFKEELFLYQRLSEFGTNAQTIEQELIDELNRMLDRQTLGALPTELQAEVQTQLKAAGYFLNPGKLQQVESLPRSDVPAELRAAAEAALGELLLLDPLAASRAGLLSEARPGVNLTNLPVAQFPTQVQELLWHYLDEVGYFVDESKRIQMMDRRLADLGAEIYEQVCRDLAGHLAAEIGHKLVAELSDDLRQGLRQAVEAQGYFDSQEAETQALDQTLGALPRADAEALALQIGSARLAASADQRLVDLPSAEQEEILVELEASDWFVDQNRLDQCMSRPLRDLAGSLPPDSVEALLRQEAEQLAQKRLSDLDRSQRGGAYRILFDQGLRADESLIRPLRSRKLGELEGETFAEVLRFLGYQAQEDWGRTPFQELAPDQQDMMSRYLGRRIMGRIERRVLLFTISSLWIDYLTDIEDLRRGIGLEAFGQRDPLVEYKRKAFELFEELAGNVRRTVVRSLLRQPPEPLAVPGG